MAIPVATSTVGGDQKTLGPRIQAATFRTPPAPDRGNCELSGIVVGTYNVTPIARQVVDAVRVGARHVGMGEIMTLDPLGFALCVPFAPVVLVVSHEFFLLRVHRNHRVAGTHFTRHPAVDMLELRVTVQMLVALLHFTVALETVLQLMQRGPYPPVAGRVTRALQGLRQCSNALASPAQGRHWVSPGQRFNKTLQLLNYRRIEGAHLLPSAPGAANPARGNRSPTDQLLLSAKNGGPSQPRDTGHLGNTPIPKRLGLCCRKQAQGPFVKRRGQSLETESNAGFGCHCPTIHVSRCYVKRLFCVNSLARAPAR